MRQRSALVEKARRDKKSSSQEKKGKDESPSATPIQTVRKNESLI